MMQELQFVGGGTRRELLRRGGLAGAALTLPSLLAACGGGGSKSASGVTAGTQAVTDAEISLLRWGLPGGIDSLNFLSTFSTDAQSVMSLAYEGLLAIDVSGKIVPLLAEDFDVTDNRKFDFTIREGVTWHDGKPFTVDDAVFQFRFHLNPDVVTAPGGYWAGRTKSVEKTGPRRLTILLNEPAPLFTAYLALQPGFILRRDQLARHKAVGSPQLLPIGTGPYRFTRFVSDSSVTAERNEDYWGEKPKVKKVEMSILAKDEARFLAMRSGQIDGTFAVPVQSLDQWKRLPDVGSEVSPSLGTWFFGMNTKAAPFDDLHVRKAFAHALDREGIVSAVWGGNATPANVLVPPGQWKSLREQSEIDSMYESFPAHPFDLDAAKAELAKSRHADGFKLTVLCTNARPLQAVTCQVYADALAKLGITLNVREVGNTQWFSEILDNDPKKLRLTINDYPVYSTDPTYNLGLVDPERAQPNNDNVANYINPAIGKLLGTARNSPDDAARADAVKEILTTAATDVPYLPIVWPQTAVAIKSEYALQGFNAYYFAQPFPAQVRERR
jgi:peptide/nickel transport system substrate-binding protein